MAKAPKSTDDRTVQSPQAPGPRDVRSTQPVPSAPPPAANETPTQPQSEQAAPAPAPEAAPALQGNVQQGEVQVSAQGGVDPNAAPVPEGNTPPPPGVPEPPPVVDKVTVVRQARTYIDDAAVVANRRVTPAESATIDQLISQKFDAGDYDPESLAESVAKEQNMSPTWADQEGQLALVVQPGQQEG